eukprot:jgi/Ulvmu1/10202/UM060_0002.1
MARELKITVYHARGLKNTQHIGKQDPYVEIKCGCHTWQSAAHKGAGACATINQSCTFSISDETFVDLAVVNHNSLMSHSVIGSARVGLKNVLQAGTETLEVSIIDKKNYGAGTVELRLEAEQGSAAHNSHAITAQSAGSVVSASPQYPFATPPDMHAVQPPSAYGMPTLPASYGENASAVPPRYEQSHVAPAHSYYPDPVSDSHSSMANHPAPYGYPSSTHPSYHMSASMAPAPLAPTADMWPPARPQSPSVGSAPNGPASGHYPIPAHLLSPRAGPPTNVMPSHFPTPATGYTPPTPWDAALPPALTPTPGGLGQHLPQPSAPPSNSFYPDPGCAQYGSTANHQGQPASAYPNVAYHDASAPTPGPIHYSTPVQETRANIDDHLTWQGKPPAGYPTVN